MVTTQKPKVVFITGAAKRIGAVMARTLHQQGMNVIVHFHTSETAANALQAELNQIRPGSAAILQADLLQSQQLAPLIEKAKQCFGQLDVLINNASSFYPTPLGEVTDKEWDDLMGSNLKAPFFLAQTAIPYLSAQKGVIINIVDIHAKRPLKTYPVYCMAKAGLAMLTKALAKELGPTIRVNGVAPGAILWPEEENTLDQATKTKIIHRTPLKRTGCPDDIAKAVLFLIEHEFITGQILNVDGGRSI